MVILGLYDGNILGERADRRRRATESDERKKGNK